MTQFKKISIISWLFALCFFNNKGVGQVTPKTGQLINYMLEVNSISPNVTHDAKTDAWIQPYQMAGNKVFLKYTLSNRINTKKGRIKGDISGNQLITSTIKGNEIGEMPGGSKLSGEFYIKGLQSGNYKLHLSYVSEHTGINPLTHIDYNYETEEAKIEYDYIVPPKPIVDIDNDGIDDKLESWLLDRYRPYFKFSDGESIFPIDANNYISQCNLKLCGSTNGDCDKNAGTIMSSITDPNSILSKYIGLNITKSSSKSAYHLSPRVGHDLFGRYYPLSSPTKEQEKILGNIGIYGHVVPIKLPNPYYYDRSHISSATDVGNMYYKIEYWQFCSYNDANGGGVGNHEADWMTVQLIVDHVGNDWKIGTILYYAHGHETQFQMNQATQGTDNPTGDQGENFLRYKGVNFGKDVEIWPISRNYSASLQNNQVRFFPDPTTGEYTHPVVYPEKGSHEYWPTDEWYIHSPTDANGRGLSFLSKNIPNLGEVENPLTEYHSSEFILRYNGFWGCWSKTNSPPPGPTMHTEWTWPETSSIRWQLKGIED